MSRLVRKLHQHLKLAVRGKTGQNPGSMVVVKQFTAEFQVQLVPELTDPFFYVL